MEILKILIVVLFFASLAAWGIWVALRAEERKEATDKKEPS